MAKGNLARLEGRLSSVFCGFGFYFVLVIMD
jgi:hypothetical protein